MAIPCCMDSMEMGNKNQKLYYISGYALGFICNILERALHKNIAQFEILSTWI